MHQLSRRSKNVHIEFGTRGEAFLHWLLGRTVQVGDDHFKQLRRLYWNHVHRPELSVRVQSVQLCEHVPIFFILLPFVPYWVVIEWKHDQLHTGWA